MKDFTILAGKMGTILWPWGSVTQFFQEEEKTVDEMSLKKRK